MFPGTWGLLIFSEVALSCKRHQEAFGAALRGREERLTAVFLPLSMWAHCEIVTCDQLHHPRDDAPREQLPIPGIWLQRSLGF